ncbi:MAG: ACP phosphodiesterase [Candidatus Marinimicrobia bacterium]|nr:ACP phosphodiesterase [Candidatus Neomarinimicrobiota bacterium]MCF7903532.1 ACP phosphodiesterase [Candidatus Neomarinimicrobiota bacterium]
MNYLAHLYLSPDDDLSRLGNIMGDFVRDVEPEHLPFPVQEGIRLHQAIDVYTDSHPIIRELRAKFTKERRRFSGIALDVVFDHFLIRNWSHIHHDPNIDAYVSECYDALWRHRDLMPERMEMVVSWMISRNWIKSYTELEGVGRALDGLAGRLRMQHKFHGIVEEIDRMYADIEKGFLAFFPQLQKHAENIISDATENSA